MKEFIDNYYVPDVYTDGDYKAIYGDKLKWAGSALRKLDEFSDFEEINYLDLPIYYLLKDSNEPKSHFYRSANPNKELIDCNVEDVVFEVFDRNIFNDVIDLYSIAYFNHGFIIRASKRSFKRFN